jgi:hypothetical protein
MQVTEQLVNLRSTLGSLEIIKGDVRGSKPIDNNEGKVYYFGANDLEFC